MPPRILITNDDGIDSPGLHACALALSQLGEVCVVAPDRNRSAVSRGITLGKTLSVVEAEVDGADVAVATDGTPTDCVRMASLGLIGDTPDLIVSGINHGLNLGDDVTYSGTVAAAFEGALMGIPSIAISQQSQRREMGFSRSTTYDFATAAYVLARVVPAALAHRETIPRGSVLAVNVPGLAPEAITGIEICRLGRRIYRDKLELKQEADGRRHFAIYGDDPTHHEEDGTDITAIGRGAVAVTPLCYDLTNVPAIARISAWGLTNSDNP